MQDFTCRKNVMHKYNKISSKMYKHLVQQKVEQQVQQKVHNNYVALFMKRFVFTKLVESFFFLLFFKHLGLGLNPESSLYFQGFWGSKLLNCCLVV